MHSAPNVFAPQLRPALHLVGIVLFVVALFKWSSSCVRLPFLCVFFALMQLLLKIEEHLSSKAVRHCIRFSLAEGAWTGIYFCKAANRNTLWNDPWLVEKWRKENKEGGNLPVLAYGWDHAAPKTIWALVEKNCRKRLMVPFEAITPELSVGGMKFLGSVVQTCPPQSKKLGKHLQEREAVKWHWRAETSHFEHLFSFMRAKDDSWSYLDLTPK